MRRHPHPVALLPPFLVGTAAAMAAEGAAGLLLYAGAGFLRALTLVLATVLGALAVGIWSVPKTVSEPVGVLKRAWALLLVSLLLGGATAYLWSRSGGFSGAAGRGSGLATLAALPLYASGHLLGVIAHVRATRGIVGPGAPAALGAAAGVVAVGWFLPRAASPTVVYGLSFVLAWIGALTHGRCLDRIIPLREPPVIDIRLLAPSDSSEEAT